MCTEMQDEAGFVWSPTREPLLTIRQEEDQNRNCVNPPIIREMLPYFAASLLAMMQRKEYLTDEDFERGCELAHIQLLYLHLDNCGDV